MAVSMNIVVPTAYGQMIVNRYDINQTAALVKTGQSINHDEICLLGDVLGVLESDPVFLDVGANFGVFSLGLSPRVGPKGKVHAFEPQRFLFNMLAGSVALNSLLNVYCHNMAVGDREGQVEVPQFDYGRPLNFGSIEFSGEQREKLTQERGHDASRMEFVPLTTLDRFRFERVDLLKVDVEGMELQVLNGAAATIRRCRPVMFVEFIKVDREALRQRLNANGYIIYENKMNYLCVPRERGDQIKAVDGRIALRRLRELA